MKLIPIVLSGGSGTRLWPISRASHPKQFSHLLKDSLQTLTLRRLQMFESPLIITSEKLKVLTEKEISDHQFIIRKIIYESEGKNTAPAVAVACRYLELLGLQGQVCGVFSSDALITKTAAFEKATKGKVVVLGIRPDRIETGFGYIQVPKNFNLNQASEVLKFHEKPNHSTAEKFIQDGSFFWNAGIFIFKVSEMIHYFKLHQPEMWSLISELHTDFDNLKEIYSKVKNISFDYAIVEKLKSEQLSCVPCDIGWSDLGSWDVLDQINSDSKEKLDIFKQPIQVDASRNTIFSKEKKVYSLVGVDDIMVVDTTDAMLICKKGQSQKVKDVVNLVKEQNNKLLEEHPFEMRPWGEFEILKDETYFKSKIIKVAPGQKISYQSHQYRSEHWIIVRGTATVVLNDTNHKLVQGQHIHIPQGAKHRIINTGSEMVEFIEVQVGSYFGEDDIIRYQDDYGR